MEEQLRRQRSTPAIEPIIRSRRKAPLRLVAPQAANPQTREIKPAIRTSATLAVLPNESVVPSPFGIYSRKEDLDFFDPNNPLVIMYGKTVEMFVFGRKLNIRDEDIFIAITQIARERGDLNFITTWQEITRRLKGNYSETVKNSILKSLQRLWTSQIKLIRYDEEGTKPEILIYQTILSRMVIDEKTEKILIHLDPFFQRIFGEKLLTGFNPLFRLGLKGDIAKALYLFCQRQVSARKKSDTVKYEIGLEKLCSLIGYDREGKVPIYDKRVRIKGGCEELKRKGYFRSYQLTKNDILKLAVKVQKPEEEEQQKALPAPAESNAEPEESEPKGRALLKQIESEVGVPVTGNRTFVAIEALKIVAVGNAIGKPRLFDEFLKWLKDQNWLKTINRGTLDPKKEVFKNRFMKEAMDYEMPSDRAIDIAFKLVTETEAERRGRQEQERKEAQAEEERQRKYEEDLEWGENCVKSNFADWAQTHHVIQKLLLERIPEMLRKIEATGKDWMGTFEEFIRAVEQAHQSGDKQDSLKSRGYSYSALFVIGREIWQSILGPII
jgi:hypothetical protein